MSVVVYELGRDEIWSVVDHESIVIAARRWADVRSVADCDLIGAYQLGRDEMRNR